MMNNKTYTKWCKMKVNSPKWPMLFCMPWSNFSKKCLREWLAAWLLKNRLQLRWHFKIYTLLQPIGGILRNPVVNNRTSSSDALRTSEISRYQSYTSPRHLSLGLGLEIEKIKVCGESTCCESNKNACLITSILSFTNLRTFRWSSPLTDYGR